MGRVQCEGFEASGSGSLRRDWRSEQVINDLVAFTAHDLHRQAAGVWPVVTDQAIRYAAVAHILQPQADRVTVQDRTGRDVESVRVFD